MPQADDFLTKLDEISPFYSSIFGHFPEIDEILREAFASDNPDEVWTPDFLEKRFRESSFFQERSDAKRNWDTESIRDPGTAQRRREQRKATLTKRASAYGVTLSAEDLDVMVETSLSWSFSDDEINDLILGKASGGVGSGILTANADQIMALAGDYLLSVPKTEADRLAIELENGNTTLDGIQSQFKREATASFPQFTDAIKAGTSIRDATSSIRSHVSNTLGISAEMIDFNNDRWTDLIDHVDDSGTRRMMTRAEAGRWARDQTEYGKTDQARSVASNLVANVSKIMGQRA